jgi:hypothetical protein
MGNLDAFFNVAGFVIDNDPAVLSYLRGESVATFASSNSSSEAHDPSDFLSSNIE